MAERQRDGNGEDQDHQERGADAGVAAEMIREKEAGEDDGEEEGAQEDKIGEAFDDDEGGGEETKAVSNDDAVRAAVGNEVDAKVTRHHVPHWSTVPYKRVFAWVLQDAQRYVQPHHYEHEQGAVIRAEHNRGGIRTSNLVAK